MNHARSLNSNLRFDPCFARPSRWRWERKPSSSSIAGLSPGNPETSAAPLPDDSGAGEGRGLKAGYGLCSR